MEEKKEYKLVDLPLPDHKLRSKAWRKAVLGLVADSYTEFATASARRSRMPSV